MKRCPLERPTRRAGLAAGLLRTIRRSVGAECARVFERYRTICKRLRAASCMRGLARAREDEAMHMSDEVDMIGIGNGYVIVESGSGVWCGYLVS